MAPGIAHFTVGHFPCVAINDSEGGNINVLLVATERQRVLVTSLGTCFADLEASGMEPPAIIVIGEVVRLRPVLDWLPKEAVHG